MLRPRITKFFLLVLFLFSLIPAVVASPELIYFYSSGCKRCEKVDAVLDEMFKNKDVSGKIVTGYGDKHSLEVRKINIDEQKNGELRKAYDLAYGVEEKFHMVTPAVFLGNRYLIGDKEIRTKLGETVRGIINNNESLLAVDQTGSRQEIVETFQNFGILPIVIAGLIDGVNPCTITSLIFFLSVLALSKGRKRMIASSLAFITGGYIAYFLIGMGLFNGIYLAKEFRIFSRWVYPTGGIMALCLSAVSFSDFRQAKERNFSGVRLKLPDRVSFFIKNLIKGSSFRTSNFLWLIGGAAFVIGFIIAGIELICTGQVYLPTLIYMSSLKIYKTKVLFYLGLYNLMVVMPQIIIALLIIKGTGILKISDFYRKHIGRIKLITAFFFLAFAVYLFTRVVS